MPIIKTEGIVVKHRDYGEADKILTVYTLEIGKISCIAKGIKRTKSKLRGSLLPFSHSNLALFKGKSLFTVTGADTIESFSLLRKDLVLMSYTSYIFELLDSIVSEEERSHDVFILLLSTLHLLKYIQPKVVVKSFEIRLLRLLGYYPHIGSCIKCGKKDGDYVFSSKDGGVFCPECYGITSRDSVSVRAGTLKVLEQLNKIHWEKINRLKLSTRDIDELDKLIDDYLQYVLQKKLLSREFIKSFVID